jgi:uncharacterized membrane protein YkoI
MAVRPLAILAVLALAAGPVLAAETPAEEAQEQSIQLSEVPEAAMNAGQKALGAKPTEAKLLPQKSGQTIYELEAKDSAGKEHSVHVSADGKVLKTEKGAE